MSISQIWDLCSRQFKLWTIYTTHIFWPNITIFKYDLDSSLWLLLVHTGTLGKFSRCLSKSWKLLSRFWRILHPFWYVLNTDSPKYSKISFPSLTSSKVRVVHKKKFDLPEEIWSSVLCWGINHHQSKGTLVAAIHVHPIIPGLRK